MGLMTRLGLKNLFKNKKIAFFSLLSIALSVAMTTMVVSLSYSIYSNKKEKIMYNSPQYNITYYNVKDYEKFIDEMDPYIDTYSLRNFNSYSILGELGEKINKEDGQVLEYYPNDKQLSYSLEREPLAPLQNVDKLSEGRFPDKNDEMLMSIKMREIYFPSLELNDTINMERNIYYSDGSIEKIIHEVKVVGFNKKDNYSNLSYVYQNDGKGTSSIEIKVNDKISRIKQFIKVVEEKDLLDKTINKDDQNYTLNLERNNAQGLSSDMSRNKMTIIVITMFIIGILYFATVSMIYNSFSTKVQQNIHDYGLLRSIGASKNQIKKAIKIESYILGIVGIVLGLILGLVLSGFLMDYINQSLYSMGFFTKEDKQLKINLPFNSMLISFIVSLILISFPISKISRDLFRQTSIESIKENKRYKNVKKPNLISEENIELKLAKRKLQIDGQKFKGIRWSLAISLIIFLSISNIIYITFYNTGSINDNVYNVSVSSRNYESYKDLKLEKEKIRKKYSDINKKRYYYLEETSFSDFLIKDENDETIIDDRNSPGGSSFYISFLDDESFNKLLLNESIPSESKTLYINESSDEQKEVEKQNPIFSNGQKIKISNDGSELMLENYDIPITIDSTFEASEGSIVYEHFKKPAIIMNETEFEKIFKMVINDTTTVSDSFNSRIYMNVSDAAIIKSELIEELSGDVMVINTEEIQFYTIQLYKLFDDLLKMVLLIVFIIVITNMISINLIQLESRKKEFSGLLSIGMTKKSLNKMIYIETILASIIPLLISFVISFIIIVAYVFVIVKVDQSIRFKINVNSLLYTLLFITTFVIVNSVVIYQSRKDQSIIDGIRSD